LPITACRLNKRVCETINRQVAKARQVRKDYSEVQNQVRARNSSDYLLAKLGDLAVSL